jgi:glycine betaine/proline transport system permease protein
LAALLLFGAALAAPGTFATFPAQWNLGLRGTIDAMQDWIIKNRIEHPLFVYGFDVVSAGIDALLGGVEALLRAPPWTVLVVAVALLGFAARGWRLALGTAAVLLIAGLFGLWQQTLTTLALMLVSVFFSLLIGIPLGVLAALRPRFETLLKPLLDAMQTLPAFVYLIPVVLFFGIARVPAVIATMVYAIPPAIRLTTLGIRTVAPSVVDAATAFGVTRQQLLRTVQLPLALPAILTGVNQTIMMALSIVVIAAMIGAAGLGQEAYLALQRLKVGQAFEAGIIIVFLAIVLDRISAGLANRAETRRSASARERGVLAPWLIAVAVIGAAFVVGVLAFPVNDFPETWRFSVARPIDGLVARLRDVLYVVTNPLSNGLTLGLLNPLRNVLQRTPWPLLILTVVLLAQRAGGWRLGLATAVMLFLIGFLGMWTLAMDTLSQVLVTMLVTMALAIPLGVLASQVGWVSRALGPINDFLQTIPTFVFLLPVIMLFNVGRVPGLIAAVLYAIPVGIRLVELGIRQVPGEIVEAATAFGSTREQTIWKVQLPLARAAIAAAINQMIMMVLAMVVISGMVGGAGLGLEAVSGLTRNAPGQGFEAGIAIVLLAIILDRITQRLARADSR